MDRKVWAELFLIKMEAKTIRWMNQPSKISFFELICKCYLVFQNQWKYVSVKEMDLYQTEQKLSLLLSL